MLMNQPKRGGIFGQRPPMIDLPNGMMNPVGTGEGLPTMPMDAPKRGGFFGQGGFGRYLAGGIADGIAAASGMQPGFANSIENQRIMQMYKQRQDDELAQYERKQQIEAQYRKPSQPTEFERLLDAAGFQPDERTKVLRDYVTNRANPMIPMQGMDESGNRTVTFLPRSGDTGGGDLPQEAVTALLRGEGTDAQFDEQFGAGAAARARGAGSGQRPF